MDTWVNQKGTIPMRPLRLTSLGTLQLRPHDGGIDQLFLSAGSATCWVGGKLYTVADTDAAVAEHELDWFTVQNALSGLPFKQLEPGLAQRIIPGLTDIVDPDQRKKAKADFEGMVIIRQRHLMALPDGPVKDEITRRFPDGLMIITGSGGKKTKKGKRKRSTAAIQGISDKGHLMGLSAPISLGPLHDHLEASGHITGELNLEGITVQGEHIILAQRGNSTDNDGQPAKDLLIYLKLEEVLHSIYTDMSIGACEVVKIVEFNLGALSVKLGGKTHKVRLNFTDVDSVSHHPDGLLAFSAAAEVPEGEHKGTIAGSVVGIIDGDKIVKVWRIPNGLKVEGVNAEYNPATRTIDMLVVPDADDPEVPAEVFAARVKAA